MSVFNFGPLTQEETAEVLAEAIDLLPDELLFPALEQALTTAQKTELAEGWFDGDKS